MTDYIRGQVIDKKVERVIDLYHRIIQGQVIYKEKEAKRFKVTEKSIQRDLQDIRAYFAADQSQGKELNYDRMKKGYVMVQKKPDTLTNSQIFTVCKILLESRSMVKEEMMPIIDKLIKGCVPYDQLQKVSHLISNEKYHYLEPHHGQKYIENMWEISNAIYEHKLMRIRYKKLKETEPVSRLIQLVGIMFSEYYFYLIAYICQSEINGLKRMIHT